MFIDIDSDSDATDEYGTSPHIEFIKSLITLGVTLNTSDDKDEYGTTSLHGAIDNEDMELVELLLNQGANVNASNNNGTPLCRAIKKGNKKVVKILLDEGADINAEDKYGTTPLHSAIDNGDMELVELLLNQGANVNASNNNGTPLCRAIKKGDKKVVKILLDKGADINAKDKYGTTPLHSAIGNRDIKLVELLLNYGANVNAKNDEGTPLWFAIKRGYEKVVKILLDKINVEGEYGTTPLHSAVGSGHMKLVELLINRGANVNASNDEGITPLHIAILNRHKEIVEILLKYGAICDSKSESNMTPLHIAALGECFNVDIVQSLLNFGVDIDSRDEYGKTALHIASKRKHGEIVIVLLEHGSDINIKDKDNNTPLDILTTDFLSDLYNEAESDDLLYILGSEEIFQIFKQHIVKMKTANLYVSEKNLELIRNFSPMPSKWVIRFSQDDCEKEVAIMKSEKICNTNISFYDILTKDTNSLEICLRNKNVVQVLRSNVCRNGPYRTKFPLYASMIESHFRKGMKRKELLEQGTEIFFNNFNELPHDCIERIFSYLSDTDLRSLMDAFKASLDSKREEKFTAQRRRKADKVGIAFRRYSVP